ncbi:sulfite exporter TauE/SafE family protein [Puteibacter caeruleilacunae]|nr:sulfite exporter TauE/SafE family protein [Puteibacter caeruleilacunae]
MSQIIILLVIGSLAGILSGALGVGGAIVVIPALIFFMGLSQHQAQGTSLAFMVPPIGILAALNYWKQGYVNWKYAAILAVAFLIGAYFSSKLAISLPVKTLRKGFGIFLLLIALRMIFSK